MGAEVIIFGQSLNSHFLKGLTHSAVWVRLAFGYILLVDKKIKI